MAKLAAIIAIIRDLVWTAVGVLVLAGLLFLASGGASHLLPAGFGNGGANSPQASGQNGNQGGNGGPLPIATPGSGGQPGPGGPPTPGGQGQPSPDGQPAPSGQPGGGPGPGGSLSISASGTFASQSAGQQVNGNFKVNAVQGSGGTVIFSATSSGGTFSFSGQVACLNRLGLDTGRVMVGGAINQSNNPTKMPPGSGFALGLAAGNPGQISFEVGFPLSGDPSPICNNEAPNLFTSQHPGLNLTSGSINIQ